MRFRVRILAILASLAMVFALAPAAMANAVGPSVPVIQSPANNSVLTTPGLTQIDWTDSTGIGTITYEYQAFSDSGYTTSIYDSGFTLSASNIPAPGTPAGVYYVRVRAQDSAGPSDSDWSNGSSNPYKITVDNTVANVQFLKNTVPADASLWGFVLTNGSDQEYASWANQITPFDSGVQTISNPTFVEIDEWAGTGTTLADYTPSVACTDNGGPVTPLASTIYAGPNGPTFYVYFAIQAGHAYVCTFTNSANSAADVWVGLKNSDDVGLKVDLQAVVKVNTVIVSTGQLLNVATGSSGFNNAKLNEISIPAFTAQPGDTLSITLNVKNICGVGSHNSGTVRLWFNGQAIDTGPTRDAGSRFEAIFASSGSGLYFLRTSSLLSVTAGSAKTFVDVAAGAKCSAYKTFGTWSVTLP